MLSLACNGTSGQRRHDNVEVSGGRVTLTGIVGSAIAKSRASDDAWVNGVLSVDDSGMKVEPWAHNDARRRLKYATRSDSDIKQAVQDAFRLDRGSQPFLST